MWALIMCSAMSQSRVLIVANDGKKFRVHLSALWSLSSYTFTHLSPGADRLIPTREPPHAPPLSPHQTIRTDSVHRRIAGCICTTVLHNVRCLP